MLVSHEHRAVFLHIQKTGGTSVRSYLAQSDPSWFFATPKNQHDMRVPKKCADYFRFTIVRNPFTRMVSGWWFFCHDPHFSKFDPVGFKPFILYTLGRSSIQLRQHLSQIWFPSQVRKLGRNRIDCHLRFEELPDCLWALPFVKRGELAGRIVHTGNRRPVLDYYREDPECYDLVLEHSKADFDRFGYSRDLPEET